MRKKVIVIFSVLFLFSALTFARKARPRPAILHDGFALNGIDGIVFASAAGDEWLFVPFDSLTDGRGIIKSGASIRILPSGMLDKLTKDRKGRIGSFRIWGKLTKYNNRNYIYLSYFLPVTAPSVADSNIVEANIPEIIPDDVMAMLQPRRIVNLAELKKGLSAESDGVIINRSGFLRKSDKGFFFDFDALGRNVDSQSFKLLNCRILEVMTNKQKYSAGLLRFKISAILTKYKGQRFLLLQRATIAFSHGNFAR